MTLSALGSCCGTMSGSWAAGAAEVSVSERVAGVSVMLFFFAGLLFLFRAGFFTGSELAVALSALDSCGTAGGGATVVGSATCGAVSETSETSLLWLEAGAFLLLDLGVEGRRGFFASGLSSALSI
ncbi:MAG: hypothetical protein Q8J76_04090 [Desulfobulbaceae bacterium]|nr:hypothetical protein [Desulfobulbaceae bacterium]